MISNDAPAVYAVTFPWPGSWQGMRDKLESVPGVPVPFDFGYNSKGPILAEGTSGTEAQVLLLSAASGDAIADALRAAGLDDVHVAQQVALA
jgi:hypothetical protein